MGPSVLPLIFAELKERAGQLVLGLWSAFTGINPPKTPQLCRTEKVFGRLCIGESTLL